MNILIRCENGGADGDLAEVFDSMDESHWLVFRCHEGTAGKSHKDTAAIRMNHNTARDLGRRLIAWADSKVNDPPSRVQDEARF